jgi:dipeptidyl aminopeptidase/acylaminoacyl peptidase
MKRILLILTFVFFSINLYSQKTFTAEDLNTLKRITEFTVSPDGNWIVYRLSTPSIADNKIYSDLYAISIDGSRTIQITNDNANDWNAVFSPKGSLLAFLSTRDGSPQIYVMDFPDGTPKKVTNIDAGVENVKFSPDGKFFVFTSEVKLFKTVAEKYPKYDKAKVRIYESLPVRHWDSWIDENYSHVFYLPISGGEPIDIMPGEPYDVPLKPFGGSDQIDVSPDGTEIAYTCKKMTGLDFVKQTNSEIYIYSLKDRTTKNITKGLTGYDWSPLYSPDGKWIAFISLERNGFESDRHRLMLYNRQTGSIAELPKNFDQWIEEKAWSPDSKYLYVAATDSGVVSLFEVSVETGNVRRLTKDRSDHGGLIATRTGMLIYSKQNILNPVEIYALNLKNNKETQITRINQEILNQFKKVKVEERWIESVDGSKVHCWVVFPPDFDPSKKYPMITYCQGGPQSMVSPRFHYRWNMYLIASHGYILLAPNRRGVPGFGQKWNDAISGDWGGLAMQDLLAATDALVKEPYVKKDGLAAIGASAGGYTTFWMAGNHKGRFRALLSHNGVFNFESMYGSTEELWFPDWEYGGPYWIEKNRPFYEKNSPHRYVSNWNTPIIISVGERDFRVPYTQGLEAFTAAQVNKIPSKLIVFPEETHFIAKLQEFLIWDREVFDFLDKYCK